MAGDPKALAGALDRLLNDHRRKRSDLSFARLASYLTIYADEILAALRASDGAGAVRDEDGSAAEAAKPSNRSLPTVEFHQHDWLPGFAAFAPGATTVNPESRAFCVLNLGAMLAALEAGDIPCSDLPYFIAESMMHEVIHVIEQWAGAEFSEERIEALLDKYRAAAIRALPLSDGGGHGA